MIDFVIASPLERSIRSVIFILIALVFRNKFNTTSFKKSNKIFRSVLFVNLLFPYSILLTVDNLNDYGIFKYLLKLNILYSEFVYSVNIYLGSFLDTYNQIIIAFILVAYFIYKIVGRNKVLSNSKLLENHLDIEEEIDSFNIKRKVRVYINDSISYPITYGIINPKIVLQTKILNNKKLLNHIIVHELSHIRSYDIVLTHIKNIVTCIYWYNILILIANKCINDDIEIACDKSVIQKLGDTKENRKNYCLSMLKLMEEGTNENSLILGMHPSKERILIMKKWHQKISGILVFIFILSFSSTSFAEVRVKDNNQVISSTEGEILPENTESRVDEIEDYEYEGLELERINFNELRSANINNSSKLSGYGHKSYKFNMAHRNANHNGFIVKISNLYSNEGVNYCITIKENNRTIYTNTYSSSTNIRVRACKNCYYEVTIINLKSESLKYNVIISSYIDK